MAGSKLRGYTVYQTKFQALGRKVAKKKHATQACLEDAVEVLIEHNLLGSSTDPPKNVYPWVVLTELDPAEMQTVSDCVLPLLEIVIEKRRSFFLCVRDCSSVFLVFPFYPENLYG